MKHFLSAALVAAVAFGNSCASEAQNVNQSASSDESVVYFTTEISPDALMRIYEALGRPAEGNNVAVKVSTGEKGNPHHLNPQLIAPLVNRIKGTIVECNTAYAGARNTTEAHRQTAEEHGFTKIARVDIMDEFGSDTLPVNGGKHLKYDLVGKNFLDYDFLVVLSHFKGHQMGGFGGALKNISIGIGSAEGKAYIHSAGKTSNVDEIWQNRADQDDFQESMAEASKAIVDHIGDRAIYINIANNLSVDCDCNGNPEKPCMEDIGIFASLDPVALDAACVDYVRNSSDPGKDKMIERIDSRHASVILRHAEELGIGTQKYKLVELK